MDSPDHPRLFDDEPCRRFDDLRAGTVIVFDKPADPSVTRGHAYRVERYHLAGMAWFIDDDGHMRCISKPTRRVTRNEMSRWSAWQGRIVSQTDE